MPTLHVENVPPDLYAAICKRAEDNGISVSDEVILELKQALLIEKDRLRRGDLYESAMRIRAQASGLPGPSAEEMLREDRRR